MSQVFYRKWRPRSWDEVVGQDHVITTLQNAVGAGRISHAYLFSGPRGTGKTSTARLLAKAVNCLAEDLTKRPCNECDYCLSINHGGFLDLIEIDAASNTSVDDVRDLREKINFSPNQARYKVYIIDEVHMLSTAAFNALLKTLEEPPSHAIFVLATTEIHKIPATVLSRCQRHEFRRIPVSIIVEHLRGIAEQEELVVEEDALKLVARQATGSLRDAISLLDQLASSEQDITLGLAQNVLGTAASQSVLTLVDAIIEQDAAQGLNSLQNALDKGSAPRQFARQIINYLRSLLLLQMGNAEQLDSSADVREKMKTHASALSPSTLLKIIRVFNEAANKSRSFWQPSLPLELAFIDALGKAHTPNEQSSLAPQKKERREIARTVAQPPTPKRETHVRPSTADVEDSNPRVGDVLKEWGAVLAAVRKKSPMTQGVLHSCKPLGIKGGKLILNFNSEINMAKMKQENHLEITRQALKQVLGQELPIECVTGTRNGNELPSTVEPDGMISTAVRDLGGKYVSDRD